MNIKDTGKGLTVIMTCEYIPCHDWMAFASWYSFQKNLPDAEFILIHSPRKMIDHELFRWCWTLRIPKYSNNDEIAIKDSKIVIAPTVMAIDSYFCGNLGPIRAKSNGIAALVDYSDGCGEFDVSKWMNRMDVPFKKAYQRFQNPEMSANEARILKLWEQMNTIYSKIKQGAS